jgi:AraC-like DNA-binding protein
MCDLGINAENFNPHIYFTFKRKFDETHVANYHSHDFASLVYVLSGTCPYNIENSIYQAKKGDLIVLNPGVQHGKIMKPGEDIMELHTGFGNIFVEGLPKNHLIEPGSCPIISVQDHEQEYLKCCSDICYAQENNEPGSELMLKINVMKLLVLFLKTTRSNQGHAEKSRVSFDSSEKSAIVSTLMTFLSENYMRPISLDTISKSIYLSPAYISKVFKEEMGVSPINYLIKIRLAKARELLLEGKLSIKSVARSVGYEDVYYFSKLYKKYHAVPPSKVRRQG